MHINFRKLTLHNFLSFGDAILEFNDDGFIKVSGKGIGVILFRSFQ